MQNQPTAISSAIFIRVPMTLHRSVIEMISPFGAEEEEEPADVLNGRKKSG